MEYKELVELFEFSEQSPWQLLPKWFMMIDTT
jgi:hypothetical protein